MTLLASSRSKAEEEVRLRVKSMGQDEVPFSATEARLGEPTNDRLAEKGTIIERRRRHLSHFLR